MGTLDGDEILEAARRRREIEAIRKAVVDELLPRSKPNVGGAVVNFVCATGLWALSLWANRDTEVWDPTHSPLMFVLGAVFPIWFVWSGYRCLVIDPRDRLLLLLAQEARLRIDEERDTKRSGENVL